MKASEMKLLLETELLGNYARHMRGHPDSLLSRFYGVYTFKVGSMDDVHCFITNNLIGKDFPNVERIYDLKGSTRGRKTKLSPEEAREDGASGMKVLKDLNFIEIPQKLDVANEDKQKVLDIIDYDSKFLAQNNLMDYSVLFIQFANRELDTEGEMPAMTLTHNKEGGIVFQLLREGMQRKTTMSKSAVTINKSVDEEEEKQVKMKLLQKTFQKRLRPQSAGSLAA